MMIMNVQLVRKSIMLSMMPAFRVNRETRTDNVNLLPRSLLGRVVPPVLSPSIARIAHRCRLACNPLARGRDLTSVLLVC